ncbi:MAG: hypothetical protein GWP59_08310, partial [Chlamydiales bacterium]|nr:hypothetical protein [Chlamydiales bacterium]
IKVLLRNFPSIDSQAIIWKSISDKAALNPHRLVKMALFIYIANIMEATRKLPRKVAVELITKALQPALSFSSPVGLLTIGPL